MKALVISDDDKSLGVIDSILQTNGIDSINYKWLIKALDNVEEIRPDLIIINVLDYPRHWKTLAQFVRSTFEDSIKILLYVPESFISDEYKKKAMESKLLFDFLLNLNMENIMELIIDMENGGKRDGKNNS